MPNKQNRETAAYAALAAGEERGLTYYFNLYYSPLVYYALTFVNEQALAQEIVSDTFSKLWELRGNLQDRSVKALLYTITRNNCIDHLRREKTKEKRMRNALRRKVSSEPSTLERLVDAETFHTLHQAVLSLPEHSRKVLFLSMWEGRSNPEIARILRLPEGTVKSQKSRALQLLKKRYEGIVSLLVSFSLIFH